MTADSIRSSKAEAAPTETSSAKLHGTDAERANAPQAVTQDDQVASENILVDKLTTLVLIITFLKGVYFQFMAAAQQVRCRHTVVLQCDAVSILP